MYWSNKLVILAMGGHKSTSSPAMCRPSIPSWLYYNRYFLRFFTVKETRSSALNALPINRQQGRGSDFFCSFRRKTNS
nr:MAG TPA: hypothetical protein [Caudoviricetes sp.]